MGLHSNFSRITDAGPVKDSRALIKKVPDTAEQSIKESSPTRCDVSKGEMIDESNTVSSSQINLPKDSNHKNTQVQQTFISTTSLLNRTGIMIVTNIYFKKKHIQRSCLAQRQLFGNRWQK